VELVQRVLRLAHPKASVGKRLGIALHDAQPNYYIVYLISKKKGLNKDNYGTAGTPKECQHCKMDARKYGTRVC